MRTKTSSESPVAKSLTDRAYELIKERIVTNQLRATEALPADRLSDKLNLGRTPIREALLRLEREGFVEIRARMGTFVAPLDIRRIRDMYQVRRILEGAAARQAADFADPGAIANLRSELRGLDTGSDANLALISETGHKLHRLIVQSCENDVLAGMIGSIQDHFRRFRAVSLQLREKVLASHQEHLHILEALRKGDGSRAERLVHAHFEHAARSLLESLISPPPRRR